MFQAAPELLHSLEHQLRKSRRSLRLNFSIGGGLFLLGICNGIDALRGLPLVSTLLSEGSLQFLLFLAGALLGFWLGNRLINLTQQPLHEHVEAILIDRLILVQLLEGQLPIQNGNLGTSLLRLPQGSAASSMAARLNWLIGNWSILMHHMGQRPLPQLVNRLHMLYLVLIILVPLSAVLLHSVMLLLVLGSIYVLGLSLDALECDAVRSVLIEVLGGEAA